MKIGIDCRYAEDNLTGIGNYIFNLSTKIAEENNELYLFYSRIPKVRIQRQNVKTIVFKTNNQYMFEQLFVPRFLSKEKIEIYHAPGNVGISAFVPCPSLVTVHDIIPLLMEKYFDKSKFPLLSAYSYIFRLRTTLFYSKKIISISNYTKKCLVEKLSINPEKIEVIGQSVEVAKSIKEKKFLNYPYIICNSGISERKNLKRLIGCFKNVREVFPAYRLVITGENLSLKNELIEFTKILGIENYVVFTGFLDIQELYSLIKGARLVCNISNIEGFGLPLLEAFSLGIPVICSDIPSFREVAGNSAIFVNQYNERDITKVLINLIRDSKKRQALVDSGYNQLKKYSWKGIIKRILETYKEITG
ncbi:glycosyltransferase family 1 protein [Candidatus Microgenomates bacterium]|jgi:glycosyltransferase involved in cell wall biosynthesis|nr:MAG: glycosyltransferase family 1 protein [Candidatus Microgenomates bacterium]